MKFSPLLLVLIQKHHHSSTSPQFIQTFILETLLGRWPQSCIEPTRGYLSLFYIGFLEFDFLERSHSHCHLPTAVLPGTPSSALRLSGRPLCAGSQGFGPDLSELRVRASRHFPSTFLSLPPQLSLSKNISSHLLHILHNFLSIITVPLKQVQSFSHLTPPLPLYPVPLIFKNSLCSFLNWSVLVPTKTTIH